MKKNREHKAVMAVLDRQLPKSWAAFVLVRGERQWVTNALRFATKAEADAYGEDLDSRWLVPKQLESRQSTDPVNAAFQGGRVQYL